jgi:spore germination protein YaaH
MRIIRAALVALAIAVAAAAALPTAAAGRCARSTVTLERSPRAHAATPGCEAPRGASAAGRRCRASVRVPPRSLRALTASTAPPPRTAGSVHAFLLASTTDSFRDFQAHYRRIGTIYPTYFDCNRTTDQIEGRDDPQITRFAKLRHVEVLPRFNCQSAAPVHRILTDPATRQRTLDGLMALVGQYGYDGLNLDIESGPAGDRQAYTSFVTDLAARLHAVGKKVSVDVSAKTQDLPAHSRSGIFDYPALAAAADHVFVMSWGIHWTTSPPGPIADWPWYTAVLAYVKSLPNQSRYILGSPLYGIDWPDGGGTAHRGTAYEYADIAALAARVGATPQWDPTAHESHFAYTDAAGTPHAAWFLPAQAVIDRLGAVRAQGLGIGVWRLGREDQAIWASL